MANRVTRASNANAHPGIVDLPTSRRSTQEVAMAKQEKAVAKALAKKKKADTIQRVAQLESEAKQKKRDTEQQANNPVDKMSQPRVKRTRNQATANRGTACHRKRQLTDLSPTMVLAGSIDGETLHAAKRPRIQQSVSSNTSASTSQNDGDVITYRKP